MREFGAECGGRGVRPPNLHLTLAFLGDVAVSRVPSFMDALDAVHGERFVLELDSCGYWRHNRIVWAGAAQCPPALSRLVEALADALHPHGFRREAREYRAHVTLLRDARRGPRAGLPQPVEWRASDFALVQSVRRERTPAYEILKSWPLK